MDNDFWLFSAGLLPDSSSDRFFHTIDQKKAQKEKHKISRNLISDQQCLYGGVDHIYCISCHLL